MKPATPRPRVYGYLRVSTDEQKRSGLSVAAQKRLIADYYQRNHADTMTWGGWLDDSGYSARRYRFFRRPSGAQTIDLLNSGDMIIAARVDRLWRRLGDFADCMEVWVYIGVQVRAVELGNLDFGSSTGYTLAASLVVNAEAESLRFGERIKLAHEERRRQGRKTNGVTPIGWRADKKVLHSQTRERTLARRVLRMHQRGLTHLQIALQLNRERQLPRPVKRKGKRPRIVYWTQSTVGRWKLAAQRKFPRNGIHGRTSQVRNRTISVKRIKRLLRDRV